MPFNGTDWINQPWNTTFKPFTDLFEPFGEAFYLIPITFIGVALYMKTRNPTVVSAYLIAVGVLMTGGGIFSGFIEVAKFYVIFIAIGIVGIFMSIYYMKNR